MRSISVLFIAGLVFAGALPAWNPTPDEQSALHRISARSMRGHLSFLASDALEGRGTPSRGLDIAAEYIAAQFRRSGLEPAGANGSYFQVADFAQVKQNIEDLRITLDSGGKSTVFTKSDASLEASAAVDLKEKSFFRLPADIASLKADEIAGKVVLGDAQTYQRRTALAKLRELKPAFIILLSKRNQPNRSEQRLQPQDAAVEAGVVILFGEKAAAVLGTPRLPTETATLSIHVSEPERKRVSLRNVAGILRGSDPSLKEQFVIFSAHYDHLGIRPEGSGDRIFNGANDNGSGTVSVIETASALSSLATHPKRSILFITFFGEEEGLLGSFYYTRHPLVPLSKTIANLNLEQMGRTDEQDGKQVSAFSFTGPSFSDVPKIMEEAAKQEDVRVYRKNDADAFFGRSDNYAFAQAGVIDHTIVVAYEYPDYHAVGDEWEKVDYENMEKVDRGVAAGLLRLADEPFVPKWSETPATERYRRAKLN